MRQYHVAANNVADPDFSLGSYKPEQDIIFPPTEDAPALARMPFPAEVQPSSPLGQAHVIPRAISASMQMFDGGDAGRRTAVYFKVWLFILRSSCCLVHARIM